MEMPPAPREPLEVGGETVAGGLSDREANPDADTATSTTSSNTDPSGQSASSTTLRILYPTSNPSLKWKKPRRDTGAITAQPLAPSRLSFVIVRPTSRRPCCPGT